MGGDKKQEPWRMIPTTPENDACVNPELVNSFLDRRDEARKRKEFETADRLLEEARTSPDNDNGEELYLRIHDESRTWRIWTTEKPSFRNSDSSSSDYDDNNKRIRNLSASEQCIEIVQQHAPQKIGEVKGLLSKFKGRE